MLSIQFSILAFSTGLKYLTRKVNLPAEIPDQSKIYFTTNNLINNIVLTISQTIPDFHDPGKEGFRKQCGKRRKCWLPAFYPLPKMFSTLFNTNFNEPPLLCRLYILSIWTCHFVES